MLQNSLPPPKVSPRRLYSDSRRVFHPHVLSLTPTTATTARALVYSVANYDDTWNVKLIAIFFCQNDSLLELSGVVRQKYGWTWKFYAKFFTRHSLIRAKGEVFVLLLLFCSFFLSTISRQPAGQFTPNFACGRTYSGSECVFSLLEVGGPLAPALHTLHGEYSFWLIHFFDWSTPLYL